MTGSAPAYRADIDGLRALAVLPVVLYHAGVAGFSGGYVGVDVFFVISGYLIAGIIAREVDEQRFSIAHFYERRARRILPALFVMIAAVLAAASFLYLPGNFEDVPRSALAALLFLANIWFFAQTGYFQDKAGTMPLLHSWSLGVEEQFYIVFPWALVAIAALAPHRRRALLWLAALASFALCQWSARLQDAFDFYMLPARAWELLAGALLAVGALPQVAARPWREALAWAGVLAIAAAVVLFDATTRFPGFAALAPVLGAALLIHCAPATSAGRLLSWRPAVWIGLLSYSLYLWHWPLIVFTEYRQGGPLEGWQSLVVLAIALLLAWASLRWIERPFRDRRRVPPRRIWQASALGMALLAGACLALISRGAWAERFPPEVARMAEARHDVSPVGERCLHTRYAEPGPECTLGNRAGVDALLRGDSHGVEFAWVLGEERLRRGRGLEQRTQGSCPPMLGYSDPVLPDCARFNAAVIAEIERRPELRTIYLAGFWAGGRYTSPQAVARLDATLARLQRNGRRVVLIGAVPTQPRPVPRALARAAAYDLARPATRTRARHVDTSGWLSGNFARWRAQGVRIVDPAEALFEGDRSRIMAGGKPLYYDSHHLTLAGARLVLESADMQDREDVVGADRDHR
ncbi:MAG: acyltransferase family protein [Erythrobacter sp.]|jgi:peptidoglycan/LPS O-acetylase OafA/YrhL